MVRAQVWQGRTSQPGPIPPPQPGGGQLGGQLGGSPRHLGEQHAGRSQEKLLLPLEPYQLSHIHRGFLCMDLCLYVEGHWWHCTYHLVPMCSFNHLLICSPPAWLHPTDGCPCQKHRSLQVANWVSRSAVIAIPICFNFKKSGFQQGVPCQEALNWNCCEFGVAFQNLVFQLRNVAVSKSCWQHLLLFWVSHNKIGWKLFLPKDIAKCKSVAIIFHFEWAENRRSNFACKEHWEIIT